MCAITPVRLLRSAKFWTLLHFCAQSLVWCHYLYGRPTMPGYEVSEVALSLSDALLRMVGFPLTNLFLGRNSVFTNHLIERIAQATNDYLALATAVLVIASNSLFWYLAVAAGDRIVLRIRNWQSQGHHE